MFQAGDDTSQAHVQDLDLVRGFRLRLVAVRAGLPGRVYLGQEQVVRLDVAVNHALFEGMLQSARGLATS